MKVIYLAGGMSGDWQKDIQDLQGCLMLDPRLWASPDPVIYTARDLAAIRASDGLLMYMDSANPSGYGLSVELGFAYALGKPVCFWDAIRSDWRSRYFGMHRQMANRVVESFVEAATWIQALP